MKALERRQEGRVGGRIRTESEGEQVGESRPAEISALQGVKQGSAPKEVGWQDPTEHMF